MRLRLAYADPPYPGKAHLYPENTEVDHVELVARLETYDGWALSTDERNLQYVLGLCPAGVRVLAWCRSNSPPMGGNPWQSWEPVVVRPARSKAPEPVRSYLVTGAPTGRAQRAGLTGQKTVEFCGWVIRALAAEREDDLDDLFPGTGIMGETWRNYCAQDRIALWVPERSRSYKARHNIASRVAEPFAGMARVYAPERL